MLLVCECVHGCLGAGGGGGCVCVGVCVWGGGGGGGCACMYHTVFSKVKPCGVICLNNINSVSHTPIFWLLLQI